MVAALAAGFLLGALLQPAARAGARSVTYENLGVFTRVLSYIQNNYVEEVDPASLIHGAIRGMLATLDAHSEFMAPEEYEEMKIDTGGEFGGIGLEVTQEGEDLVVVTPLHGTPAARAGLVPGDVLMKIDGQETADMSLAEAVRLMRGPPGTEVSLTVDRSGFAEPRDIPVRREHIRVNPVEAKLVEGFALLEVKSFQDRTVDYIRRSLEQLKDESGSELRGLIVDLRNNPGGLLDQAVSVADLWLSEGTIVTTKGRGTREEVQRAHRGETEPGYPMVVLINEGSASASEILAGALQDHGRAVLMGTTSFGKGSVQTVIDLDDGSGLKLTVARYFTPRGTPIGEKGIRPDVLVEDERSRPRPGGSEQVSEEALEKEPDARDNQLKAAIDALRTWHIFQSNAPVSPKAAAARP